MNYLLLTEYFPESESAEITGGVEGRCFNLVKQMAKENNIVVLCSRQPGQKKRSTVFGAKVVRCGPTMDYSNQGDMIKRIKIAYSFYKEGKKFKKSNVVEGASFLTYLPAFFLGKKLRARKVATWHETWIGEWVKHKGLLTGVFGSIWERLALKLKWDKIISVSDFTRKRLLKRGVRCKNIEIVPNGINLKELKQISSTKHSKPTICYFGRINWQKNLDVLIKSIAEIKKQFPSVQCQIMGGGPALNSLRQLTKKLALEDRVIFTGQIKKHGDLLKKAKKCHLYVHPSTLEGFGITVLEAMACNLVCVLSSITPFKEITNNKAIFFKSRKELTEKLINLLQNQNLYKKQLSVQDKIIKNYDWKEISKKWLN